MKITQKLVLLGLLGFAGVAQANLLTNGGFEDSTSTTTTPTGWTNVGHSDGVIGYAVFGTPAYDGAYFYDLGGYGDPFGPIGDGIKQSFATTIGASYKVSFGVSSENRSLDSTLTASAAGSSFDYLFSPDGTGDFQKPFVSKSFSFIALSALTTLSFIHTAGKGGNNDPLIDGVNVELASGGPNVGAVPLPGAAWLFGTAIAGFAGFGRRKVF